ncbi:MAG: TIGR03032 family protein [Methylococcales bacterium]|nr:TIGR03032 family protein [Methylococcales bacterium]
MAAPKSVRGDVGCRVDTSFSQWLATANCSLAVTTYQAGKLLFLGWDGQRPTLNARNFQRAMGIDTRGDSLVLASDTEIRFFQNASVLADDFIPDQPSRYDALYLERSIFHTGDLFVHDLAFTHDGIVFVNTRFSCIAAVSHEYSFVPIWQPPFIKELMPGDLCHLNGLATLNDELKSATALGVSNTVGGWRENKASGGIVIDIPSNEIVLAGLSMPHSPRWYRDQLWLLNSGKGELLRLSKDGSTPEVICQLPAYLRGLAFYGDTAIVGLCRIREKTVFGGLPIDDKHTELLCGLALVDLNRGVCSGIFEFTEGVEEIYDIRVLPNIGKASIYPREHPMVEGAFTAPDFSYWIRPDEDQDE